MNRSSRLLILTALVSIGMTALAREAEQTAPAPGFRPQSEYAGTFLDAVDTATIAVLPTLIRRSERTAHSFASQAQITRFLNEEGVAAAITRNRRIKMLPLQPVSQWDLFQYGLDTVASALEGYDTGADYTLVMEFLLPVDHVIWGIEVYVLDRDGYNAFSFLLNEHHEIFTAAKLQARGSSEAARTKMIANATQVGLLALQQQIREARTDQPDESAAALQ